MLILPLDGEKVVPCGVESWRRTTICGYSTKPAPAGPGIALARLGRYATAVLAGFGFGEEGNTREFLRGLSIYLLLIPAISSTLLARRVGELHRLADLRQRPGALAVALAVLSPPVALGGVLITLAVIQINSAAQ